MSLNALVLHPFAVKSDRGMRSPEASLEEAVRLSHAIDLNIVHADVAALRDIKPATHIGKGKIDEIKPLIESQNITVAILNTHLTPIQQRNLEKAWNCKVIDRTALILEIFGARARTKEGTLQVALAALEYQKSRLVRSWTHLERQRGGGGFLGGPGERQIELDRRIIRDRIAVIKKQLDKVVRTRTLHRKHRKDVPYPLVALVGYTNAGKSTLFNTLSRAEILAEDALFATLDPTIRKVTLPHGMETMLSDTVGFISDLPTHLVAAFRATLEEVLEADLILHVRDISHPDSLAQKEDVEEVLEALYEGRDEAPMIEVYNKIDQLSDEESEMLPRDRTPCVSAITGEGVETLLETINERLSALLYVENTYSLDYSQGRAIAWLHEHGEVTNTQDDGEGLRLTATLSPANAARFEKMVEKNSTV